MGSEASSARSLSYVYGLDGLRALSVLAVILYHFDLRGSSVVATAVNRTLEFSFVGVDIFFVISGYLITAILLKHLAGNGRYFVDFWRNRALRVFPLYYAALLLALVLTAHPIPHSQFYTGVPAGFRWAPFLAFVQNLWIGTGQPFTLALLPTWSLAVEEQFYWLWPVLVFFIPKRHLWKACAGIILFSWTVRVLFADASMGHPYFMTFTRIDELSLGSLLAVVIPEGQRQAGGALRNYARWTTVTGAAIACATVLVLARSHPWQGLSDSIPFRVFGYWGIALFSTGLVALVVLSSRESALIRFLSLRPLAYIGKISYGMYLLQGIGILGFEQLMGFFQVKLGFSRMGAEPTANWWLLEPLMCAVVIGLTVAAASASFYLFESKFLRLKAKEKASPSPVLHTEPAPN